MSPYSCLSFPSKPIASSPLTTSMSHPRRVGGTTTTSEFPKTAWYSPLGYLSVFSAATVPQPMAAWVSSGFLSVALPPLPSAPPTQLPHGSQTASVFLWSTSVSPRSLSVSPPYFLGCLIVSPNTSSPLTASVWFHTVSVSPPHLVVWDPTPAA